METKFESLTKGYQKDLLNNLKGLVAVDSKYDEATVDKDNPFGKGVTKALQYVANLAKEDGFEVNNYSNMIVEILCGHGDKNITIMAHADVVPEGSGWSHDPFDMYEKDGVLYGRGVADDKGPMMSAYYAMKALRDNNLLGNYTIRFLVGGNEESGSRGMYHYFYELNKPQPTLGFSPDASFPLIFAEKGIFGYLVYDEFELKNIYSIKGGVASNAVIDKCDVLMKKDVKFLSYLDKNDVKHKLQDKGDNIVVSFFGKAAHGSVPQFGINAGMIAIKTLGEFYNIDKFKFLTEKYSDVYGLGVNAYNYSEEMGKNSLNVGIISYENNNFKMIVNFRFVDHVDSNQLKKNIEEATKPFKTKFGEGVEVLYYPKESPLVSILLKSYQEETNDYETPIQAIGGGTYAKEAQNVVAFGMEFPGWDSKMHSPGECIEVSALFKGMAIYANAILALGKYIDEN